MSVTLVLPYGFHYLAPALFSTALVLVGQSVIVGKYRKRAKIEYPQAYAEKQQMEESNDALLFNCAQRAHQNTLELIPIVYVMTILGGLAFPVFSAFACVCWSIERISYTRGYITGKPENRLTFIHKVASFPTLGLFAASVYTAATALQFPQAVGFILQILRKTTQNSGI